MIFELNIMLLYACVWSVNLVAYYSLTYNVTYICKIVMTRAYFM